MLYIKEHLVARAKKTPEKSSNLMKLFQHVLRASRPEKDQTLNIVFKVY